MTDAASGWSRQNPAGSRLACLRRPGAPLTPGGPGLGRPACARLGAWIRFSPAGGLCGPDRKQRQEPGNEARLGSGESAPGMLCGHPPPGSSQVAGASTCPPCVSAGAPARSWLSGRPRPGSVVTASQAGGRRPGRGGEAEGHTPPLWRAFNKRMRLRHRGSRLRPPASSAGAAPSQPQRAEHPRPAAALC